MKDYTTISKFARLTFLGKVKMLEYAGVLLEKYPDNENLVSVYRLFDFFIEVSKCSKTDTIVDVLPFVRGVVFTGIEPSVKTCNALQQAA